MRFSRGRGRAEAMDTMYRKDGARGQEWTRGDLPMLVAFAAATLGHQMVAHSVAPLDGALRQRDWQGVTTMTTTFSEPTLAETIDHLNRRGFTGHFGVVADGLREFGTGVTFRADELRICDCFRFDAASDPGDMAIIYAIERRTGVRGTRRDGRGGWSKPAIS